MYKTYLYLDKINLDAKTIQSIFRKKHTQSELRTFKEPLEFQAHLKNIDADIKSVQGCKFCIIIALDFSYHDPLAPLELLNEKYPLLTQKSLIIVFVEAFKEFDRKIAFNLGADLIYEKPWHYQGMLQIFDDIQKLTSKRQSESQLNAGAL